MTGQALRGVSIKLTKVKVKDYMPKENSVELEIFFEGVSSRRIVKRVSLGRVERTASGIIESVISQEKYLSVRFDGERIRERRVDFADKTIATRRLAGFLRTVHSKAQRIRKSSFAAGYIDLIKSMQREELLLEND